MKLRPYMLEGINVPRFISTFSPSDIEKVGHFLRAFPLYKELTEYFEQMEEDRLEYGRELSLALAKRFKDSGGRKRKPKKDREPIAMDEVGEPKAPNMPVAHCPRCDSVVMGMPVSKCELARSGRVFYKECSACTYYAEIFEIDEEFIEKEGG